jgi:hypothetical protein
MAIVLQRCSWLWVLLVLNSVLAGSIGATSSLRTRIFSAYETKWTELTLIEWFTVLKRPTPELR